MTNQIKAAAYMRYSSYNQSETSIDCQRTVITDYCKNNNINLVKEYIDKAVSGTTAKRDSFQELMNDAQNHPEWSMVMIYDYSRFSRDYTDSGNYTKLLEQNNIELFSITQPFGNTNEGVLIRNITYAYNDYFSKNNAKTTHDALTTRAKKGLHCGGLPPLGYDLNEDYELIINEDEAKIVHEIFDMYEMGYSYSKMAKILNEKGYKTKHGQPFGKNSFASILQQEKYTGTYVWNKVIYKDVRGVRTSKQKPLEKQVIVENACPVIIDRGQHTRVQNIINNKALRRPLSPRSHYMLSNSKILKCAECGAYMIGAKNNSHGREYEVYYCPNHKIHTCTMPQIQAKNLNTLVAGLLASEIYKRKDLDKIFYVIQNNDNIKKYKRQLEGKELAIDNVLTAIQNGYNRLLTKRLAKLQAEKEELEKKLNDEKAKNSYF